jgi:hypothetical protein
MAGWNWAKLDKAKRLIFKLSTSFASKHFKTVFKILNTKSLNFLVLALPKFSERISHIASVDVVCKSRLPSWKYLLNPAMNTSIPGVNSLVA